jgi:hypothetical protein
MDTQNCSLEEARERTATEEVPCPQCGTPLVLLAGFWKCGLCQFCFCASCEGVEA